MTKRVQDLIVKGRTHISLSSKHTAVEIVLLNVLIVKMASQCQVSIQSWHLDTQEQYCSVDKLVCQMVQKVFFEKRSLIKLYLLSEDRISACTKQRPRSNRLPEAKMAAFGDSYQFICWLPLGSGNISHKIFLLESESPNNESPLEWHHSQSGDKHLISFFLRFQNF